MKSTKEQREAIRKYILECIDLSGYDKYQTAKSDKERLQAVYEIFKQEKGYELDRHTHKSEQTIFCDWLQGLPSCFNIDFENYRILELTREWGFLPEKASAAKEQRILDLWWGRMYMAFRKALTEKEKVVKYPKIKTIDITAKEWFDKVNGNSYHSAQVTINYRQKNAKVVYVPFQYGYGNHYETTSFQALQESGMIDRKLDSYTPLWRYCEENKITLRTNKISNCLKRDVVAFGAN